MKRNILIGAIVLLAGPLLAADAKDDVTAAAKKLAAKGNYSWKSTTDLGANSPFQPGPVEGKTADGLTWMSTSFQDNTTEGVMKGTNNIVVKTEEGWKKADEITGGGGGGGGGGFNPATFFVGNMQRLRTPSAEVEALAGQAKELKKDGDAISGDLTEDGAKAMATFGRGRRGGGAGPTNVKGSIKVWVKDGEVTKYQTKVTGKRQGQDGEVDFERTTTVEIKDVGTTKINVPDEAKKKLG